jgi:DNA-binding Lrp family transcriptional regulator
MPRALVFINSRFENTELVNDLAKVEGVSEAYPSRGMYDAVAMVQAETFTKVKEIVAQRIRNIDSVKSTLTLTLIEAPMP